MTHDNLWPLTWVWLTSLACCVIFNAWYALQETYKYKELDDEVEEELRLELAQIKRDKAAEMIEMEVKQDLCYRKCCKTFKPNWVVINTIFFFFQLNEYANVNANCINKED